MDGLRIKLINKLLLLKKNREQYIKITKMKNIHFNQNGKKITCPTSVSSEF